MVAKLLCSGVSLNRAAMLLHLNRKTVVRYFLILALLAEFEFRAKNARRSAREIEFDDLETFEHTKYKALSVTLGVEAGSRRILGLEVSRMPAKGILASKARRIYGQRDDGRPRARGRFFRALSSFCEEESVFRSDKNPHYPKSLKETFPQALHLRFEGRRGALTGQGELKRVGFDPLFSLNHTCAMLRANVNRLFRKTWCTTKRADRLEAHLLLYAHFHNAYLLNS